MIKLSKSNLSAIDSIEKPDNSVFQLPEKVLQFGTGVLLRGLPDYFIDKANKRGIFGGRVVVVKSTSRNSADEFAEQDGLYTVCIRGWKNNAVQSADHLNVSLSRVVNANTQWPDVLQCAQNPELKIIISNTTEAGIVLRTEDAINTDVAPVSFPGKLLAFLYHRYRFFNGKMDAGMVIIPTELIPENGKVLKDICVQLAKTHGLGNDFIQWLETANAFCDSLVDRIVPGKPQPQQAAKIFQALGYEDDLMIISESYALWAIQSTNPLVKEILSFHLADERVIIAENIEKYRTLKLYLLNASHTFSCVLALQGGFRYVKEAMIDSVFEHYIKSLLLRESVGAITDDDIGHDEAEGFAEDVLDRFRNPFIEHKWSDIAKQVTLKMRMRCIPLIKRYYDKFEQIPFLMVKGFAAYLLFMRTLKGEHGNFIATVNQDNFVLEDEKAEKLYSYWLSGNIEDVINGILSDQDLWGDDLTSLEGFGAAVIKEVGLLINASLEKI